MTIAPPSPEVFRSVLGHFASGITVITGMRDSQPVGFTCQSFSALSLDPPMVVIVPALTSQSWPPIAQSGHFCVSVLAHDQQSVCGSFARSGTDKFTGVDWKPSPLGSPMIIGACAWIDCRIEATHAGGDHEIVVGAVHHLEADAEREPLLFHRGGFAHAVPQPRQ